MDTKLLASARDATSFKHENERALPGRYTVTLDSGVKTDLAVTTRAGVGAFTSRATRLAAIGLFPQPQGRVELLVGSPLFPRGYDGASLTGGGARRTEPSLRRPTVPT
ncbi:hypothetical protein OHA18_38635 [Kribbella sp. NBC_00709]|uniref:hypothetical protein n=1 Tax=Kribbella sp. NBC_00709 TaxID=2975972 RepID=UPI002E29E711|nr:hypothetical protein [Kribbella sp. NBC_00709]